MGTRGFIGFVADGVEKIAYNHWDSYPGGLGVGVLEWLAGSDLDVLREQAKALRVVSPEAQPTPEDIERLRPYTDLGVGEQSTNDWYCLLRHTQGKPAVMLEAGAIEDASGFPADSLFAEWGYVVDFDAKVFEAYQGFQHNAHTEGRFASRPVEPTKSGNHYYPVRLVASWPLDALPTAEEFIAKLEPQSDES